MLVFVGYSRISIDLKSSGGILGWIWYEINVKIVQKSYLLRYRLMLSQFKSQTGQWIKKNIKQYLNGGS